jgi:D-serine deaminase-like pyridoxal phosphate-dependent protein
MARYFADHGWNDITIAFPVNWRQIEEIDDLAERVNLHLLVDSVETAQMLRERLVHRAKIWIDVDADYHRTGIPWDDTEQILAVGQEIVESSQLDLKGVLTHAGNTYHAHSTAEIVEIHRGAVAKLGHARTALEQAGFGAVEVSIGDSPACSVVEELGAVDEIRPGQFVFNDVMLLLLGACREDEIALAVVCPVVAKYPNRGELIIYGGAVHLSKDSVSDKNGRRLFGLVARFNGQGWGRIEPDCHVSSLSQEVGIVRVNDDLMNSIEIGASLAIIPVHSCLTVDVQTVAYTLEGGTIEIADYRPYLSSFRSDQEKPALR